MITLLHSVLNFGHPIEKPVTIVWGAGIIVQQDDTPIPTFYVITLDHYRQRFIISCDYFKMILFVWDLSVHTLHVILTASIIRSFFQHKHLQLVFLFCYNVWQMHTQKHKHTLFSLTCYVSVSGYYYIIIIIFHNKEVTDPIHCCTINNIHFTYYHIVNSTLTTLTRVSWTAYITQTACLPRKTCPARTNVCVSVYHVCVTLCVNCVLKYCTKYWSLFSHF